ncbi:carbon-nitrogen hydrolase [Dyadobacter tibetensis]|uniref:carbon-nitrogen hydrolase n=1 Tax=Dyadobacter tibetensis TaxID=1211851 RepID=UPI00047141AF|nr:carbon-nitrogen hydrolase [Dyadobacter tibetensis]
MKKDVNIGLVQMSCSSDVEANQRKAVERIREAAAQGAQIICLQELYKSLYFCDIEDHNNFDLAEAIPGATTDTLGELAKELGVVIIASLFEKRAQGLYHNTTAVLDADGRYLGKYRKMHIPDDPGYYEKFYFTPGDADSTESDRNGYRIFDTQFAKIGVLICWDQWYPEAARITSLMGAEILFYPTAIGWDTNETDPLINEEQYGAWQTIQRGHAVANGVYVVAVNRVGREADQQFWGGSFIANPQGRLLYLAPHQDEVVHTETIDLGKLNYYRTTWPFLRDRRVDSYAPILRRFID